MAERKSGDGCKGCFYFSAGSRDEGSCLFCLRTGKSRGCPAGKGCIRYTPNTTGKRLRKFLAEF